MKINILRYVFLFIICSLFFNLNNVNAKDTKKNKIKKTEINFEDELIEGEVKKPELLYLLQRKQFNYKKLIKLRKNFIKEMEQTGNSIPREGE